MSEQKNTGIRIVGIAGSVRPGNYTLKALTLAMDELQQLSNVQSELIDPAEMQLPFPGNDGKSDAQELKDKVASATGVILSTPEYHGGYSSVIKLVIENLGFPSVLSGKPVALLGVAAGQIGAIKSLESLRGVCSHIGAIVLPAPVSVAGVQKVFDENGRCLDEKVEKRVRSVAGNLIDYIQQHICPKITLEAMVREAEQQ